MIFAMVPMAAEIKVNPASLRTNRLFLQGLAMQGYDAERYFAELDASQAAQTQANIAYGLMGPVDESELTR